MAATNAGALNAPLVGEEGTASQLPHPPLRAGSIGVLQENAMPADFVLVHMTPMTLMSRPKIQQRDTSPEEGPGDRVGNVMVDMMMT